MASKAVIHILCLFVFIRFLVFLFHFSNGAFTTALFTKKALGVCASRPLYTRFVWTVVKGKAHQQHVEVGGFCNNDIIVLSGLGAGDEVIVGGQQKVSEGMRVCAGKNVER